MHSRYSQCIADIRRALQDKQREILKTVPRRGYLFVVQQSVSLSETVDLLPFIGRNDELSELEKVLKNPACRLLVILGLGGVGKPRLSQALQRKLLSEQYYQQGIVFVPLA